MTHFERIKAEASIRAEALCDPKLDFELRRFPRLMDALVSERTSQQSKDKQDA